MEGHRVKSIVIVILLIINGFLLVLVGDRYSEARQYEQAALDGSIQVLTQKGIELRPEHILSRSGQPVLTAQRDLEAESRLASAMLGEQVESSSLGGGLYAYDSVNGQISFRAGGELSSQLEKTAYWSTSDPEVHAAALIDALGVECRRLEFDVLGGNGTVVYQQMLDGVPLFSCQITLTYADGYLTALSGNLMALDEPSTQSGEILSLPTVLMHFLDDVLENGDVCSSILAVEAGYLQSQSFTSTISLQPVWYISTNTADYYVNGVTGDLSRVIN